MNKKISFIILFFVFLQNYHPFSQVSQEWLKYYNDSVRFENNQFRYSTDLLYAMTIDDSDNVYITGYSYFYYMSISQVRSVTLKYNKSGDLKWVAAYPQNYTGMLYEPAAIETDKNGNVYVFCKKGGSHSKYFTIKFNATGTLIWAVEFNSGNYDECYPSSIALDKLGNVYVTGTNYAYPSANGYDFLTVKYDSLGSQQWLVRFDGTYHLDDIASLIKLDEFGNVVVSGFSKRSSTDKDFCTVKYNNNGVQLWVKTVHYGFEDEINDMVVDTAGNIYVTGIISPTNQTREYCTIKYSPGGEELWLKRFLGPDGYNYNCSYAIDVDKFGNVFVTGYTEKYVGLEDYVTIKYSSAGTELWRVFYDGLSHSIDIASDLKVDFEGNCYVTGECFENGKEGYTTVKYNSEGVQQWVSRIDSAGAITSFYPKICVSNTNKVYISGIGKNGLYGGDYVLSKYNQIIGIRSISTEIPKEFSLSQNYPNPFNPITKIKFSVPELSIVKLKIFDVTGKELTVIVNGEMKPGIYEADWNGSDFSSGVYFYRLESDKYSETRKMVLIK